MFDVRPPKYVDSVFTHGRRRRLNAVAICLNVFLPWFVFTGIYFVQIISFHHRDWVTTWALVAAIGGIPLVATGLLVYFTSKEYDPSWFKMSFLLHLFAAVSASWYGYSTYYYQMKPYYELARLQTYPQLDVSKTSGRNVQDAGRVYFAAGTHIDTTHSWHFQAGSVYCVAPIVGAGQDLKTTPVDFWAIGKDCCSIGSSDFRCGDFSSAAARSGLRFLESDSWFPERHLYRLAVKGAEGLYGATTGLHSPNPLFFTWRQDPLHELNLLRDTGWGHFMLSMQAFFVFDVTIVALATCRFAYLGRREAKPLLGEDE